MSAPHPHHPNGDNVTPEQLAEIKTRDEAATPGPWQAGGDDSVGLGIENDDFGGFAFDVVLAEVTTQSDRNNDMGCTPNRDSITLGTIKADAEFIAHARQDLPALLAEVERLRTDNAWLGRHYRQATEADEAVHEKVSAALGVDDGVSWDALVDKARQAREENGRLTAERDAAVRAACGIVDGA